MKRPASWPGDLGREATLLGNGKTGVLVYGGVGKEKIQFNRSDLWNHAERTELPKLDGALLKMREMIDAGDYLHANDYMYNQLLESGYQSDTGAPFPLGMLQIKFSTDSLFSHYRRKLHMDTAESEITYTQKNRHVIRRCFVSRKEDTFYYEYKADEPIEALVYFGLYDDNTEGYQRFRQEIGDGCRITCNGNKIDFKVKSPWAEYGAVITVYGENVKQNEQNIRVQGTWFRIAVKCASNKRALARMKATEDFNYEEQLKKHLPLHRRLYNAVDIRLGKGQKRSNEELLEEAYEDKASPELIEKMWRFGRYLFICGVCKEGLPFPLYGLWHTKYDAQWPAHVANENVEIIHWHAAVGGLSELVRPLIGYYSSHMDVYREQAEKLYGCKGIFIGGYTSPANHQMSTFVPVILNFTGVAGWISQHFYKYYQMTGDRKLLEEKILPFMVEAARFYLDYLTYDEDGHVVYYPGVSPENTPANLITKEALQLKRGHKNPVTKNPVMEIAIVKELFTNLLALIQETGQYTEFALRLQKALENMPPYLINQDGALKEWATDELADNYAHRHVSHIYPLFPGEEIAKEEDPELYKAIERAVDLRELGAQSGWSLAHTASIYATLERGEDVLECLDILFKGCTLNNLVTLHNDYRNMGVALNWKQYPVQMDANMGAVNAVQKMLIDERKGFLLLLPAISDRFVKGRAEKLRFSQGTVSMKWDLSQQQFHAEINWKRDGILKIRLPKGVTEPNLRISDAIYELSDRIITVQAKAGAKLSIEY